MRMIKAAFVLLIALDLIIMLLAVFVLTPLWVLISILTSAGLKGIHDHVRIKQKIRQYYKLKNRNKPEEYKLSSYK